jgi:hypothetical protein
VQTFLPYPGFIDSAAVLDGPRLGKQRVETLQILRALQLPDYGWQNHPAVLMWRGRVPALVSYGLSCVATWRALGRADSTAHQIAEFAPEALSQPELRQRGLLPSWLGDDRLHESHRSRLIAKDAGYYRPLFPDTQADLDYYWPAPDEVPVEDPTIGLDRLWVIRPATELALGRCVHLGLIGFGFETGVLEDASDRGPVELRSLLPAGARRNNRALRALAALTGELQPGSPVAVPIMAGAVLLAGEVTGDYAFVAKDEYGLNHRRSVRWHRMLPRSAARPFGALQDVRPLFEIAVTE